MKVLISWYIIFLSQDQINLKKKKKNYFGILNMWLLRVKYKLRANHISKLAI